MIPTWNERLNERVNNRIIARLDSVEARLVLINEDLHEVSVEANNRFFGVNEALRSIDEFGGRYAETIESQGLEIKRLRAKLEEIEDKQIAQEGLNRVFTRYIRTFGKNISHLLRMVFRLNNNIESDNPDISILEV